MSSKGGTVGKGANKIDVEGLGATFSTVLLSLTLSSNFLGLLWCIQHTQYQKGCGVIGESVYRGMSEVSQLTFWITFLSDSIV